MHPDSGAISDNFSFLLLQFFSFSVVFPGSVDPLEGLTVAPSNNSDTGK